MSQTAGGADPVVGGAQQLITCGRGGCEGEIGGSHWGEPCSSHIPLNQLLLPQLVVFRSNDSSIKQVIELGKERRKLSVHGAVHEKARTVSGGKGNRESKKD